MPREPEVQLIDLITCLSDAMDYISPSIVDHHRQVAYISYRLGEEIGLPIEQQKELILAGALHDIGAFSLHERKDILRFGAPGPYEHAEKGYGLLKGFEPLSRIALIIRYHHQKWNSGSGAEAGKQKVPHASHVVHLADRIAILVQRKREVLGQVARISKTVRQQSGEMFNPRLVDAFLQLSSKESFWLDLTSRSILSGVPVRLKSMGIKLGSEDMLGFALLFSRIIDFKSPFTATHTSGVAASASLLARLTGLSGKDSLLMRIAGYLHDLGKLAIPLEILHKPAQLSTHESNVMRHHTFYTYRILETLPSFHVISQWAAFHHERLDGSGYPFHLKAKELPAGSQVMAVADIFTAITEDRPYRKGMTKSSALRVLCGMAERSAINRDIVAVLQDNYEEVNRVRLLAQRKAAREYDEFRRSSQPASI